MDTLNATITNARYAFSMKNGFFLQIEVNWNGENKTGSVHPIYSKPQVDDLMRKANFKHENIGIGEDELKKLKGIQVLIVTSEKNPVYMGLKQ